MLGTAAILGISALLHAQGQMATGTVVAIQKPAGGVRMADPHSMGEMVEVWMVELQHLHKDLRHPKFILIEYTHRDQAIPERTLDTSIWQFSLKLPLEPTESRNCLNWWPDQQSFVATAQGRKMRLPAPEKLPCYVVNVRPTPVEKTHGKPRL